MNPFPLPQPQAASIEIQFRNPANEDTGSLTELLEDDAAREQSTMAEFHGAPIFIPHAIGSDGAESEAS